MTPVHFISSQESRTRGELLHVDKERLPKTYSLVKDGIFLASPVTRQRCLLSLSSLSIVLGVLAVLQGKKRKADEKGRNKTQLADAMTIYTKNSKAFTKTFLELKNEFSKVTGHNINM